MATLNFTIIYSHTILTIWKQMSQATEGPNSPHYYFNFTGWILGPRVKMLFPVGLPFKVPTLFLGNGVPGNWGKTKSPGCTCRKCLWLPLMAWHAVNMLSGPKEKKRHSPHMASSDTQCAVVLPLKVCLFTRPPPTPPARKGKVSCYHAMKMTAQIPVALV